MLLFELQNFMSVPVEEVIPNLFSPGIDFHYLHGNFSLSYVAERSNMACRNRNKDNYATTRKTVPKSLLGIRIRLILGLPDLNPSVRGTDLDPSLFSKRC